MTIEYRRKKARREAVLNRQRRKALMLFISVIAGLWIVKSDIFTTATEAANTSYSYVAVEKGDTLWGIALKYKPENQDIRDFVRLVADCNELSDTYVRAGDTIKIPR